MSRAFPRPSDPSANLPDPAANFLSPQDDRDLNALKRLFDSLNDEARALRADARLLGDRVERLGRTASGGCVG